MVFMSRQAATHFSVVGRPARRSVISPPLSTVQKQISRQLSVTYATNVNSTAQQLLQGQYDLTPNVSLVVARDETGVFSVVYKIRRRYR